MAYDGDANPSGFYFLASAASFAVSGVSGLVSYYQRQQLKALESAIVVKSSDISSLKARIEADPTKRLYVKMTGRLASERPLNIKTSAGQEHTAVLSAHEVVYLQGLNLSSGRAVVNDVSTADDVTIELGVPSNVNGPKLIIDPRCLELVQRDHVDSVEKEVGSRTVSAILSLLGASWPYRSITNTMIVPQNRHVYSALDATIDLNGDVTLSKPNTWDRRAILTADIATTVTDDMTHSMRLWTAGAFTTGVAGIVFAALGFKNSK